MHRGPDVARLGQGQGHEHLFSCGGTWEEKQEEEGEEGGLERALKARLGGNIM